MQDQPEIYFIVVIGIVLGLLLVGFIVTMLVMYQRRQQRQEQEMQRLKDMYENELLRSQLEIQENTFRNISQELHDNIGQMLSVTKLSLSALPVEKHHAAFDALQHSQKVLNKAIFDLSNLTKSLHSDRIAQVGLVESIRFELDAIAKSKVFKVEFHIQGREIALEDQKSIFLFRIFQETLNNILKHSKASLVSINLKFLPHAFILEMRDNGIGFNVIQKKTSASAHSGVGLKSVFNRAQLIGAEISMNSEPGKGTEVIIELPLTNHD